MEADSFGIDLLKLCFEEKTGSRMGLGNKQNNTSTGENFQSDPMGGWS